jgi:hypothetical protein
MRTPRDFDQTNESAKTATASTESRIPTDMCITAREPALSSVEKNPENEDNGPVVALAGRKMFTVSPDQPCKVSRANTPTNRTLNFLEVTLLTESKEDFIALV